MRGKVSLITGGGRGIGRAIGIALAAEGAKLAISGRTASDVEQTANIVREAGGEAFPFRGDVSREKDVERIVSEVEARWGPVDVLVNNAAVQGPIGPVVNAPVKDWLRTLEVDLYGPFLLCHRVLPGMLERRSGKIINLSGGGATSSRPNFSAYAASKAALVRLTETLAEEVRDFNVQVNAIAPGAVSTKMTQEILETDAAGESEIAAARDVVESGGTPLEKVTALAVFLASESSGKLSGRLISPVWDDWKIWRNVVEEMPAEAGKLRRLPLGAPTTPNSGPTAGWLSATDPGAST